MTPAGAKPSWLVRFERPGESPPPMPNRKPTAIRMKATIATTLMPANQNSNSPKDFTENRLIPVSSAISTQRHQPQRRVDPALQDLGAGHRLDGEDDRPEVPVEPADAEARPAAQRPPRVLGERADLRVGDRHLAEHPHDEHDQEAGRR